MKIVDIYPHLDGIRINLDQVPDEAFSSGMVGGGVAVEPLDNWVYAPIDGKIISIHRKGHALTIETNDGFNLLIHVGIDLIDLQRSPFKWSCQVGDYVDSGDIIGEFDMDSLALNVKSLASPMVVIDADMPFKLEVKPKLFTDLNAPIMSVCYDDKILATINNSSVLKTDELFTEVITITNHHGIHARPAAVIAAIAAKYDGELYLKKGNDKANLKSISALIGLGALYEDRVEIIAGDYRAIEEIRQALEHFADEISPEISHVANSQENTPTTNHIPNSKGKVLAGKFFGTSASSGIVSAMLDVFDSDNYLIDEEATDIILEEERFTNACAQVKSDIEKQISLLAKDDLSAKNILQTHLSMLADSELILATLQLIKKNKTAAYSYHHIIETQCSKLAALQNQLLGDRQEDFKDLRARVLRALNVRGSNLGDGLDEADMLPVILVRRDFGLSDFMNIRPNVVGVVSVNGGTTSHVAILARAIGLPLLVGVDEALLGVTKDRIIGSAILDTDMGFLDISPNHEDLREYQIKITRKKENKDKAKKVAQEPSITTDSHEIRCMANISNLEEVKSFKESGGVGVGLFRTEFIYFDRKSSPSYTEQAQIYEEINASLDKDTPFIIRTLDAGGEKILDYLAMPEEVNPALGIRGIRLTLRHRELLLDQLRAILQVNRGNIKIMLPMISDISEYREVKELIGQLQFDMGITTVIELGIMVEVPAVVLQCESFAEEVDFFSLGTNDLTQYIFALDRENQELSHKVDHLHPAVLRAIQMVAQAGDKANKMVSVCGLLASDRLGIIVLIGLGIVNLSMNINEIALNKAFIRRLSYKECREHTLYALSMNNASEVRSLLTEQFKHVLH